MLVTSCCPTEETLQRFMLGENTPEEAESLEAHLDSCERCIVRFSTLQADDSLIEAIRSPKSEAEQTATESDHLLAEWLKAFRPEAALPRGEAGTVDETPEKKGNGDTTIAYAFLGPGKDPRDLGRLGRYEVRRVLGSGGMGVVFEAFDPDLQRLVALKTTLPARAENPSTQKRFLREARAAAAIKHDHIVIIYDVGEDHGVAYLAMELLEGESLDQRIQRERRLPWREALRITRESAQGLAAAHKFKLIHRDIKPGNIWLESRAEGREARDESKATDRPLLAAGLSPLAPRVKILDFGLALPAAESVSLTQSGAVVGTPAFMAPEQCRGQGVDARSDLFSLGCVLYRMATGEAPFRGNHAISTLIAVATTSPRPPQELNPELPRPVCDLIMRLLAKDPADRPPSAAALIDEIQAIEQDRARPAAPARRARRPTVWAGAGAVAACLLGLFGFWSWHFSQPDPLIDARRSRIVDDSALKAVSGAGKGPRQFYADPAHALEGILDHREVTGADADAFRKWRDSLGPDFRLAWFNTRHGTGPILYNAVAVREKTPRLVRFRFDLPKAAHKDVWDSMCLDGFRFLCFTDEPAADAAALPTQSSLWGQDAAITKWGVRPGTLTEVIDVLKEGRDQGYRPYQFDVGGPKDAPIFTITTALIQNRLWEADHGLTAEELLATVKNYKDRGWRPDVVTPYYDNAKLRFILVAVGNDDGPDWRFRMAMSPEEYKQESAEQHERGMFPLAIASYGNDADVRYAAIWVRCREPGTKAPEPSAPDAKMLADRAVKAVSWASAEPTENYVDGARALGEIVDFRELVGGTVQELRDWHDKLDPKFRVATVTSRNGVGEILFNAVAVQEKEPVPVRLHIQMEGEAAVQTHRQNEADGYRIISDCATLSPGEQMPWQTTHIWVKHGKDGQIYWHGWLPDVVSWTKKDSAKNYRPIWLNARKAPPDGGIGTNCVLGPSHGRAWDLFATLTTDELLAALDFYQRKGWRPDVVVPYLTKDNELRHILVVVENSDKVDWRFRADLSRAEYRQESAQQSRLGLFPLIITSYGNEADIRYAAIWVRFRAPQAEKAEAPPDAKTLADRAVKAVTWNGPERKGRYADKARALAEVLDFRELAGGTANQLRDWQQNLDRKFRVALITSRKGTGPTLFNAVAVQEKKSLPSHFEFDITQDATDQVYKQKDADGFRLIGICANLSAEQKLPWKNSLLWVKDGDLLDWNWYGSLQNIIESNATKKLEGYRPIYLSGTMFPGEPRYNTVMARDQGRAWEVSYSRTPHELFSKIESYKRKGWRPDMLAPHWVGDMRHMLVGVDNSDQVDWRFRMDMNLADYQKESAQQKREGLFPLSVVSYGNDADVRYAAIFVRYLDPTRK